MPTPEMSPTNTPSPSEDAGDLGSELDEMIGESAPAPEAEPAVASEPEAPEAPAAEKPSPAETLAGLDDMLSEAAVKAETTLSPLDEPEDIDPFADLAGDETETDEAAGGDDPEASSISEEMDSGDAPDSATELARELEETIHGAAATEESLYDDDPDETDAPEVYGPGDAFEEPTAEDAKSDDAPEAEPEADADATAEDATDEPGTAEAIAEEPAAGEGVVEAKPGKRSPVATIMGALAPAAKLGGPLRGASIAAADVLAAPLAKLSTNQRDLVGYAAITLLFNALCLVAVLLFL